MIKPVGTSILVLPKKECNTTKSGIVRVKSSSDTIEATVVSIGKGVINSEVSVGDTVIVSALAGTRISHEGTEYVILKHDNILIVL